MNDLLIPRYKVIADYPGSKSDCLNIGDIITDDGKKAAINQNGVPVFPMEWHKYPHLFQPMSWYAERKVEEMPLYLKKGNKVIQVSYEYFDNQLMVRNVINENLMPLGAIGDLVPATKDEYEQYIKNT